MIKTGIISANEINLHQTPILQEFEDLKLTAVVAGYNMLTEKMLHFQAEALVKESRLTYFDQTQPPFELIKFALRSRSHLLFNKAQPLKESELKQLINLSHEADAVVQFVIPLIFNSENLVEVKKIKAPFLANIRLSLSPDKLDDENFMQLLLLLILLDNSDFRKADLMMLPDENGHNVLEARLVFRSGSVARILLSGHFTTSESGIELFPMGSKSTRIQADPASFAPGNIPETNAIRNLIRTINRQPSVNVNFIHFYQASQILQNLKSKINYTGGFFTKNRFVG